jgi:hypothetical protein
MKILSFSISAAYLIMCVGLFLGFFGFLEWRFLYFGHLHHGMIIVGSLLYSLMVTVIVVVLWEIVRGVIGRKQPLPKE